MAAVRVCRALSRLAEPSGAPRLTRPLSAAASCRLARPGVSRTGTALRVPRAGLAQRSGPRATAGQSLSRPAPAPGPAFVGIDSADVVDAGEAGRCVRVQWHDDSESLYPFVWLRDNCQCSACFLSHPTFVRALVLRDLDVDATARGCEVSEDGGGLTVTWSDGHRSAFAADWLLARSFRAEERRQRLEEHRVQRRHWDAAELAGRLPQADFQQVLDSEPARLEVLLALERYGLVVLKGCGEQRGQVLRLISTIGYPHTTHYGTTFEVRTKVDPINIAYTTKRLNMHADLPYYEQRPQVQLLHYRRQHGGAGGRSEFADALHVASELRAQQPDAYRLLADTPVDWVNVTLPGETGRGHYKLHRAPVLEEDSEGHLVGLRFSQAQRDSFFSVPLAVVERWYRAFALFNSMLNSERFKVSFLPEKGDMVMFDNTRLAHGREDFQQPQQAQHRCLEGGYIGLDDVRDHRRTLQHRLGENVYGL